jgi:uncharacterized phage protein (TIGR01671 family)
MNREIKFRGYDKDNKRWRYGHFFETIEGIRNCYNILENKDIRYYCNYKSITQYTGVIDRNGVEIYEGDIVNFDKVEWGGDDNIHVVTWDKTYGCWCFGGGSISDMEFREVIGNIYENPELLEK